MPPPSEKRKLDLSVYAFFEKVNISAVLYLLKGKP